MNAGRELDVLVASRVMGYDRFEGCACDCGNGRPLAPACGYDIDPRKGAEPHTWRPPHFSTRIEHAWEVVEHITHHELKFGWRIALTSSGIVIGIAPENGIYANVGCESLPLGICLTALKVCNVPLMPLPVPADHVALQIEKPQ